MDASTVGKRPTEIVWLWSPDLQLGGWAPPQVPLSDSDSSQPVDTVNFSNLIKLVISSFKDSTVLKCDIFWTHLFPSLDRNQTDKT